MKFANAYEGIKKIFLGEIFAIIAACISVAAAFLVFFSIPGLLVAGIFSIGAAVLSVLAVIINLVGLHKAAQDEVDFKTAFILSFIQLALGIVTGFSSQIPVNGIDNYLSLATTLVGCLILYYVIDGIRTLASQLGDEKVNKNGKNLSTFICILYIAQFVCILIKVFVQDLAVIGIVGIIGLALSVAALVALIIYLVYLSDAKKMLANVQTNEMSSVEETVGEKPAAEEKTEEKVDDISEESEEEKENKKEEPTVPER